MKNYFLKGCVFCLGVVLIGFFLIENIQPKNNCDLVKNKKYCL